MKKVILLVSAVVMMIVLLAACSDDGNGESVQQPGTTPQEAGNAEETQDTAAQPQDGETVTITFFNTSAEINDVFEEMFARYNELNPNVIVELIPTGIGGGQQEQLQALYAGGNAPTILNVDPVNVIEYAVHLAEFTQENSPWLWTYGAEGVVEAGTFDGRVLGAPWSVQGFGLLYNVRVVNEIFGGNFDRNTINTQDALRDFLETVEAAGVAGTLLHGANWSMGAHFLSLAYALQGTASSDGINFLYSLMDGTQNIEDCPIWRGLMDTFRMLVEHNYNRNDPLVANYDQDVLAFGEGRSATMFMGDWAWSVMGGFQGVDQEYGFLPVPWSNNPNDYGNTQIVMVIPKLNAVDASRSTPEQRQAAFDFLGWMHTDPEGQQFLLDAGFFMPFTNVRDDIEYNSMVQATAWYADQGRTINFGVFDYISADVWIETGNLMLQYMSGFITRDQLAEGINSYWRAQQ
ncbi:MAG: ABC transporter substrate-binding protein [Oscillospiraceae bacterium]|nr:ABC transporter substrate-binding protein [Oscillospiraceae bacterium]